eukprot:4660308-Pyramimonas_sp.AAC.1
MGAVAPCSRAGQRRRWNPRMGPPSAPGARRNGSGSAVQIRHDASTFGRERRPPLEPRSV